MAKRRANGEGSIYKRTDGLWCAQYTDNMGKVRYLYGKTQQIVKDKLKEAQRKSDDGLFMDKDKITFSAWMIEWLEVFVKPSLKPSSYAAYYGFVYNHIVPAFPTVLLKDLRVDMLQKFFNEKAEGGRLDKERDPVTGKMNLKTGGLSFETLKRLRGTIRTALNQAIDNRMITYNPAIKVRLPKKMTIEKRPLTMDEQAKLLSAALADDHPLGLAIALAIHTGMRMGEILALQINDLDFDALEINVRRTLYRTHIPHEKCWKILVGEPKTEKSKRTIPMTKTIAPRLKERVEAVSAEKALMRKYADEIDFEGREEWVYQDFLFISLYGKPYEHSGLQQHFSNMLDANDIDPINFHSLRHTFATRCIEAGLDVKTVSDLLGHANAAITLNTYTHALDSRKRDGMNKLESYMDDGENP